MRHAYRAHGLDVRSAVELPLPRADRPAADWDLRLSTGRARPVPPDAPPGEHWATATGRDGRVFYRFGHGVDGAVLRYPGLCDFVGDHGFRDVVAHRDPATDPGVVGVLAGGTLLAIHLKLRGALVLHAGAVQVGGGALAFVGASGMGKSTLCTLFCARGHRLVSDDLLRVEGSGTGPVVRPGSTESRLRAGARSLAASAAPGRTRETADGRLAVRPELCTGDRLPLTACVVPFPTRALSAPSVARLTGARALLRLAQFPRIVGWTRPGAAVGDFAALADLVSAVPVYEARIPWGPPFDPDLPDELLAHLGSAGQVA